MADLTIDNINSILSSVVDKYTEQDIVSSNAINNINIDGDKVEITIELNYPAKGYHDELASKLQML
jgi:ATP-binding protein involved in chromosome partitioning